jgi:hypothetical protein
LAVAVVKRLEWFLSQKGEKKRVEKEGEKRYITPGSGVDRRRGAVYLLFV